MDLKAEKIADIFQKISWLDKNRWKLESDYTDNCSINLSCDLTNSDKILTHFLCYISDRGMTFSQIWDKGGFVYSNIVNAYKNEESIDKLFNLGANDSFYKKIGDSGKNTKKYGFVSRILVPKDKDNTLIKDYGCKEGEPLTFISRYYPSDLKSILQTLMVLEDAKFERNIIRYIAYILKELDSESVVKRLAFALYLLGYYNIRQPKRTEYNEIVKDAIKNKYEILKILDDKDKFEEKFENIWKYQNLYQKRVWCSLRDYVKSPEFKEYTIKGFEEINEKYLIEKWNRLDLTELELPGDIWNNNPKFKACLFSGLADVNKNTNASSFIRNIYEDFKNHIDEGYPEMFDVTFDFVPRMCSENRCDFCIFKEHNKLDQLCTKDESKCCPVLLISCGYTNKCDKMECSIL